MKGSYHFRVRSRRVLFDFTVRRNITVIKGDSATGKTTLLRMLYEYLRSGKESGYSVAADVGYYVYLRREVGRDWTDALLPLENTIIFIEENNEFVYTERFAEFVKKSGNYFVFVSRAPLKMLPYSIHEIYGIVTEGSRTGVKESYHSFKELYSNYPDLRSNRAQNVLVEDSGSGYQFFSHVFAHRFVLSAEGNGNICAALERVKTGDTLVIADGAAFGALMERCLEYIREQKQQRIALWLPESFEYLILRSGLISFGKWKQIMAAPSDYIDSKEYESWEIYFTDLLTRLTADTTHPYSKRKLDVYYLMGGNRKKIVESFPDEIKALL